MKNCTILSNLEFYRKSYAPRKMSIRFRAALSLNNTKHLSVRNQFWGGKLRHFSKHFFIGKILLKKHIKTHFLII